MNIYVGNLDFKVNEDDLKKIFEEYGTVSSTKIITDKFSGRSKGFGFVQDGSKDAKYFLHYSKCLDEVGEGDKVVFNIEKGAKGFDAINVRLDK